MNSGAIFAIAGGVGVRHERKQGPAAPDGGLEGGC